MTKVVLNLEAFKNSYSPIVWTNWTRSHFSRVTHLTPSKIVLASDTSL